MKTVRNLLCIATSLLVVATTAQEVSDEKKEPAEEKEMNPKVLFETSHGDIMIELDAEKAPLTVKHFLDLVDEGHYDGIIFHRAVKGFVIQAGSFDQDSKPRNVGTTVKNEASNGLKNDKGTVSMARTSDPDSAAADFFINTVDNDFLNPTRNSAGYAVFGKVIRGMEVVHAIEDMEVHTKEIQGQKFPDFPKETVVITSASRARSE